MKIIINKTNAILSGFTALFMSMFCIYYLKSGMYPEAPVFLIIALIFSCLFIRNASSLTVTQNSVSRSFFGFRKKELLWADVKEVGLIGENVFSHNKNRTGHKYIYISPRSMTQKERFDMIVKWPPKNILYMEYSKKNLEYTMAIWGKELKTYNVEDLFPNTED
ncbi:MAG: hypothetical protein Q4C91_05255 [Eubacteriales bacterium]|nr:hypothetical protein [Eubacteriales bacterium]